MGRNCSYVCKDERAVNTREGRLKCERLVCRSDSLCCLTMATSPHINDLVSNDCIESSNCWKVPFLLFQCCAVLLADVKPLPGADGVLAPAEGSASSRTVYYRQKVILSS